MSVAALDNAVLSTLKADATLTAVAPGGVYRDVAPLDVSQPFVIVTLMAHEDVPQQATLPAYEMGRFLVKAVDQDTDAASAETAADRIQALLNGASLSISGYSAMGCWREERVSYVEVDGPVRWQHRGGIYVVTAGQ
jgi:hypothetical protein